MTSIADRRMDQDPRFDIWRTTLPDARCRNRQYQVWTPCGLMTLIFCVNCGRSGGAVTAHVPDVFYLCQACAETHGRLSLPEVPEHLVRPKEG